MTPRHKEVNKDEIMQDTRQKLLEAAAEEIAQYGFDKANVNRIARQAGFSIGTFYNYFPTKRDLMLAFIQAASQAHVEAMVLQVREQENPVQRMEAFFRSGFEYVEAHPIPSRAIFNTLNGPDDEFKQTLFMAYLPLFQLINQDILGLGIERGVFRSMDQTSTANLLMLVYLGTGSQFSPEGSLWMEPGQVAEFVLNALKV